MATTYYEFRGTVARIVRDDAGMTVGLWSGRTRDWIDFPEILGYLTGEGGDPAADEITAGQAAAFVALPAARRPMLDGPGPDVSYGSSGRSIHE